MRLLGLLTIAFASGLSLSSVTIAREPSAPLIPREALFGDPVAQTVLISPDGRTLAWLAPRDGVMNIWIAPRSDVTSARPLTNFSDRSLTNLTWAPDSSAILFLRDNQGDENSKLFAASLQTEKVRSLTPFADDVRVTLEKVSPLKADAVLITVNARDPSNPDLYRLHLATGKRTLVKRNDQGIARWITTPKLEYAGAVRPVDGGGAVVLNGNDEPVSIIPDGSFLKTYPVSTNLLGTEAYFVDSRNSNTAQLSSINLETGASRVLFSSVKADLDDTLVNPLSGEPIAGATVYQRKEWEAVDEGVANDLRLLARELDGELTFTSFSADFQTWIVLSNAPNAPSQYFVYDRKTARLRPLFTSRPDLSDAPLQPQQPLVIRSRDGLPLISYLTTPRGWKKGSAPLPMVLHVHGGPWGRDRYGYSSWHQWLANRGYAVLSVNYRGSIGFGQDFVDASSGEFAGKMHDDLIDGIDWAIDQGIADPERIAISGGSYGGYAALVGLSFTPERFACAVDLVGMSNLATLIEGFPDYWAPYLENTWYKYVGNPSDPEERADLMRRSPISRVDAISKPLLIAQGENDPRVPKSESDQIAERLIERGVDVSYINFPDEGHGFVRRENKLAFYAVTEKFLASCLGGRAEAISGELTASSIETLHLGKSLEGLENDMIPRSVLRRSGQD